MKSDVKIFIENQCLFEFSEEITETTNLFKEGYLDSFSFVELVMFLENRFNIKFQPNELLAKDFCSLDAVINSLLRKGVTID